MFAYALLAMFQEQPEVGWDLITMWHNMGDSRAKTVVVFCSSCRRGRSVS